MTAAETRTAIESVRQRMLRGTPSGLAVTVVGGARSGLAVAKLLARRGAEVFLTEHGPLAPEAAADLDTAGVAYESGGHTDRALAAELVVLSPGVPSTIDLVQTAIARGVPVASEIEVASWFCKGPIVAVTGSNGKTTTTTLIAHVFKTAGRKHVVAGNIGTAFSDYVDEIDEETAVILEVSSFQLDHVATFRPHVAVLLNVTPDHLDRYGGSMERYAAAKYRLFEAAQQPGDWLIYNKDDEAVAAHVEAWASGAGVTPVPFSIDEPLALGAWVRHAGDGADTGLKATSSRSRCRPQAPGPPARPHRPP
ncbi:MAG: Mur ligase family protein, partial [Bacteroidota bacterium]